MRRLVARRNRKSVCQLVDAYTPKEGRPSESDTAGEPPIFGSAGKGKGCYLASLRSKRRPWPMPVVECLIRQDA